MPLKEAAQRVVDEFNYTAEDVRKTVKEFLKQMDEGLEKSGMPMAQIPTYVTSVPNGTEKGLYMAVDLGGTNFRVCSIQLHGNTTFSLTQSKIAIPKELMVAKTSKELFSFLAKQIEIFLQRHHNDHFIAHKEKRGKGDQLHDEDIFSLGFTFSFPVHQIAINQGTLIRWTKGFDIKETIGQDVCALLQTEIDALGLPVKVAALVNDTVGTLMARSYTSPGKTGTLLGAIFGTGTNGAYVEKLDRIKKFNTAELKASDYDTTTGEMIVNTEWGSFDNALKVLPNTPYDADLDAESNNPGIQMFEKRISGMFLGEIFRRALVALIKHTDTPIFRDGDSGSNDLHTTTVVNEDSPIFQQWGVDTSFLSTASGDTTQGLRLTRQALQQLGIDSVSADAAAAVKELATAVGRRAARLSGMAVGAVIIASEKLNPKASSVPVEKDGDDDDTIDVGVDGSLVEFYPGFEDYMREVFREIPEIGEVGEKKIRVGIAKDGSGVGAALIALVADRAGAATPGLAMTKSRED